jgi:F-type H+-transporting ATPase subunit delta
MKISAKQYAQALFELVKEEKRDKVTKIVTRFAQFLTDNNDAFKFVRINKEFCRLWDKEFSIVTAEIKSAHKLSQETEIILEKYIKTISGASSLAITKKIDEAVLGGVVIKYGDKIFDAGLKSRLEKIRAAISD